MSTRFEAISPIVGDQVTIGKRIFKPAVVVPVSLVVGLALGALVAVLIMGMPAIRALQGPGAHAVITDNTLTRSEASTLAENPELSVARRSAVARIRGQANESAYLAGNPELSWARRSAESGIYAQGSESANLARNPELSWSRRRAGSLPGMGGCSAYLAENPELSWTRRASQGGTTGFCP